MALDKLTKIQKIGINTTTIPTLGGSENVGVVTATNFIGDGSGLTGVTGSGSGVIVRDGGSLVGTAGTINFGTNLNVSTISAGIVTVTNAASATSLTGLSDVTVTSASNGQILKHNGSVFVNTAETNTTYSQSSVASGSNINLRLTDSDGTNDDILITAGSNITFSSVSASGFTIAASGGGGGGGLSNVVEDTTPELGGNLNLNNKFITGSGGINVSGVTTSTAFVGNITGNLTGNITGAVTVGGNISGPLLSITGTSGNDGIILLNSAGGSNNDFTRLRQVISDDSFVIENKASGSYQSFFKGNSDRGAELHYQGNKKLETDQAGVKITGVCTATSFSGDGSALTGITASSSGIIIRHDGSVVGTASSINFSTNLDVSAISAGIVTVTASGSSGLSNIIEDSSPQLGGQLDSNGNHIKLLNSNKLILGSLSTYEIYNDSSNLIIDQNTDGLVTYIRGKQNGTIQFDASDTGNQVAAKFKFSNDSTPVSSAELYHSGTKKFETDQAGVKITGVCTATSFVGDLTGDVTGNADTATAATRVTVTNQSSDTTCNVLFTQAATGDLTPHSATSLAFNSSSGALTAGSFVKSGGNSAQFLKADGSVDSNTYLTSGSYLENVSEDSTPDLGGNLNLNSKDITGTGNVNITGIVTTTNLDVSVAYTLGASSSSHYTFTGGEFTTATNDPDLYLERGRRYLFVNPVAGSHPFEIRKPTSGDSSAVAYSTGVTGNGGSGNVIFDVPLTAPSHLYYQCTSHSNMGGNIYITGREDVNVQLSHRNLIINGAMEVSQRGGSVVTVANDTSTFKVDRFGFYERTNGSAQLRQSTDVPAGQGFYNSLHANVVSTDTSLDANQLSRFRYVVEDVDVKHLQWGTANAKPLTVSFWVKSNVAGQTFCFNVSNWPNNSRSFIAEYTLPSGTANSWQKHVINIPGDTTGTWTHITLQWILGTSSDYQRSGTGWGGWSGSGGLEISTTNQYNWFGDSNHFYLTGVQLERGNVSTPFEHRSHGEELARCQRYLVVYGGGGSRHLGTASAYNSTNLNLSIHLPVPMRASPSASTVTSGGNWLQAYVGASGNTSNATISVADTAEDHSSIRLYLQNAHSGLSAGQALWCHTIANAKLILTAEL